MSHLGDTPLKYDVGKYFSKWGEGHPVAGRRGNHEGSIYRRSSYGRWMGEILLGYRPEGRPQRKSVSARTRQEVV